MAETFGYHLGQILVRRGNPAARAHCVTSCSLRRSWLLAAPEGPCGAHHELAELADAEVGGAKMLLGAILDRTLAVLDGGVLLADAGDTGEARGFLLPPIDQVVVSPIAQRQVILIDNRMHAEAAGDLRAFGVGERPIGAPAVGVEPTVGVA